MYLLLVLLVPYCWGSCPADSVCDGNYKKCYKFATNEASYFAAEEDCVSLGGHLTSIQNAFENGRVGELADSMFAGYNVDFTDYWIGANYIINNKWSWTDNSAWQYTDWFPGEPSAKTAVSVLLKNHLWKPNDPDTQKPYVCELLYSTQLPPTCPSVAPVTCPTLSCPATSTCPHIARCESGWTLFGTTEQCYKTFYWQSFWLAEEDCKRYGGHLVSIHSDAENDFVSELATTGYKVQPMNGTNIGLYLENNVWLWTDGSLVDYEAWAPGEPNGENDNCARLYPAGDTRYGEEVVKKWKAWGCGDNVRNFVCKKPAIFS